MHKGYIGVIDNVYLAGMNASQKHFAEQKGREIATPVSQIFYISAFQAGIEKFVGLKSTEDVDNLPFMAGRIEIPADDAQMNKQIIEVVKAFIKDDKDAQDQSYIISGYLLSLIGAAKHNASALNIIPPPTPAEVNRIVEPELAIPIIQLMEAVTPIAESLPIPKSSIDRSNVTRFNELIESDLFSKYCESHSSLSESSRNLDNTASEIHLYGNKLVKQAKSILSSQPTMIKVLTFAPKLIDPILGSLPGALADIFGIMAEEKIARNQTVVTYQYNEWLKRADVVNLIRKYKSE